MAQNGYTQRVRNARTRGKTLPPYGPQPGGTMSWFLSSDAYATLCGQGGFTPLNKSPEVVLAARKIAELVGTMTIHLMHNTDHGDERVHNGLSRKVDIEPYSLMTRHAWMAAIVFTLLVEGDGNAIVLPTFTPEGYLADLQPLPPDKVTFRETTDGYRVVCEGKEYRHDEILHFVINPTPGKPWMGSGYRIVLRDAVQNLAQASQTKNSFLASKYMPSLIIKADVMTEEMSEEEGRRRLFERYVASSRAGEPWIVPAEMVEVEQIKPLSLTDLAINDTIKLDKRTVAAMFGAPPFLLGEGEYAKDAYNNFISATILPLAQAIEQEMTRKLLESPDFYFKFNPRSLYAYDIVELTNVSAGLYVRGVMTGNEARDWLGMTPMEGLDELKILENFIPADKVGDQKKLTGGGEKNE